MPSRESPLLRTIPNIRLIYSEIFDMRTSENLEADKEIDALNPLGNCDHPCRVSNMGSDLKGRPPGLRARVTAPIGYQYNPETVHECVSIHSIEILVGIAGPEIGPTLH